jgi:hypothetical protein
VWRVRQGLGLWALWPTLRAVQCLVHDIAIGARGCAGGMPGPLLQNEGVKSDQGWREKVAHDTNFYGVPASHMVRGCLQASMASNGRSLFCVRWCRNSVADFLHRLLRPHHILSSIFDDVLHSSGSNVGTTGKTLYLPRRRYAIEETHLLHD